MAAVLSFCSEGCSEDQVHHSGAVGYDDCFGAQYGNGGGLTGGPPVHCKHCKQFAATTIAAAKLWCCEGPF